MNRLLARKLIVVEGANGRKGGRNQPTIYRVVMPEEFFHRDKKNTWREAQIQSWQDAHAAPPVVKAQRARTEKDDGHGQPAADKERRQKPARSGAKAAKTDTKRRHSIAAEPKEEPVVSKDNRSALPRGPQGGRGIGKENRGASKPRAKLRVDLDTQRQESEAIRRQWELTGRAKHEAQLKQATGLLLALQPKLGRAQAESEVWGLKLKYDHTWEPVIGALAECGQTKPPPASPLRWLLRHAARYGNRLVPDF